MALKWLLSSASEVVSPVLEATWTLASSWSGRRVWTHDNRTHLEVSGIHLTGTQHAADVLVDRLLATKGVEHVEVNAALSRVVVTHDRATVSAAELAEIVAEVETEHDLRQGGTAEASLHYPANAGPIVREATALCAGVLGVGYSMITSALPVPVLSPVIPAATSLISSVPWMRSTIERQLGRPLTDATLAAAGVLTQTAAQRPFALTTDVFQRWISSRELLARLESWQRWENEAATRPDGQSVAAFDVPARPAALPDGPIEQISDAAGWVALGGYGATLATTASTARALSLLHVATPTAMQTGRDSFAAQLATSLSQRGGLVLDPDALRRLDRVDAVVFDSGMLVNGRKTISSVVPLDNRYEVATCWERASELIDPRRPRPRGGATGWSTARLKDDLSQLPPNTHDHAQDLAAHADMLFTLRRDSIPVALVVIETELDPLAEALIEAARQCGLVAVAGNPRLCERLDADRPVPGGARLADSVRQLQHEGHVVAAVSGTSHSALASSDVGIGVLDSSRTTPWGADLVCVTTAHVYVVLSGIPQARWVSRTSATIFLGAASCGTLLAALGPAGTAPQRASLPLHAATLTNLTLGFWAGTRVSNEPPPPARRRTPWHAMAIRTVLNALGSTENGISDADARRRRGPEVQGPTGIGITQATLEGLITPMTAVLGAGAAVSAVVGSLTDAVLITSVLAASGVVDGVQRVTTNRELAKLLEAGAVSTRLRRDGVTRVVPAEELVVGDIVELRAGDSVPADCRLVDAENVEVDESSLTGESQSVSKSPQPTGSPTVADRTSMVYQGTAIAAGEATAIVVATGQQTELGATTLLNGDLEEATGGVEARLNALAQRTLPISAGAGGLVMLADLLRGSPIGYAVSRSVGLAVAAVPEGLPFVATIAETASARRLAGRGILVRKPSTIEALGRVDVLCFDKTGTLTTGTISVREVSDGTGSRAVHDLSPWLRQVMLTAVRASPAETDQPLPHPTDQAVVDAAHSAGIAAEVDAATLRADLPFEPSRGYHAVQNDLGDKEQISVKGAPEVVLERCSRWRSSSATTVFDAEARRIVDAEVERLASNGHRVLAVAERDTTTSGGSGNDELDDSDVDDLEFLGLLALADPVHTTAADSVRRLHRAGIDIIMITGDHPSTAEAIAVELDMLHDKRIVTGAELDTMDDDELAATLPKIAVFARVSPAQKARIVRQLHRTGRVTAMTGDGANDVPAINLASVGIALGSRATPAARETADMVIADDRIETITEAIVEGRGMWISVRDALAMLLGGNLGEIAFTLGAGVLGTNAAPNARQLLVINLLTDVLPALALAIQPPPNTNAEQLLAEGPEASLGTSLTRDITTRAAATAGGAGLAWLLTRVSGMAGQARTTGLVALVAGQLGQTVVLRGNTVLVLLAGAGSLAVLAVIVQVPGVSQFFGNQPLLPHQWVIALGSAAVATGVVTVARWGQP